ncbi:MAG TPA: hypothetical protein PK282_08895, partial [Rhodoglobus sp.]|nr:hypothetical protein [Rhodoglobus sp.]
FRTDFLDPSSVSHGAQSIEDYRAGADDRRAWLDRMNHAQLGDPARFGPAIAHLVALADPPVRVGLGSEAIAAFTVVDLRVEEPDLEESVLGLYAKESTDD